MRRSTLYMLLLILGLTALGGYVAWPGVRSLFGREARVVRGLDLQGGLQVLLEADLPAGQQPTDEQMNDARQIIEQRVNAIGGVTEPVIQRQGSDRIVVELPGVTDPQQAIRTFQSTGLLEFVEQGNNPPFAPGQRIRTDYAPTGQNTTPTGAATAGGAAPTNATAVPAGTRPALEEPDGTVLPAGTPAAAQANAATTTPAVGAAAQPTAQATPEPTGPVYHTVMTGANIESASVGVDPQTQRPVVQFELDREGARIFGEFTTTHVQQPFAIVVDKEIISAPTIQEPITGGQGQITGVSASEARTLAIQLRYGSLPVPFRIESSSTVGATLGQDSVDRSITAGVIGVLAVALFMILYYRLPGVVSVVALAIYATLVFALFKLIPVVLTLAGIAGFVLSIGMAVDANVLIFARMKEELRRGRNLAQAVEAGFKNAWPSIRDSNVSTLITCFILGWFGSTFGASIIRGFAITLAIGVLVSMFTAIVVTRSLLRLVVQWPAVRNVWLWGVARDEVTAPAMRPGAGPALGGSRAR